MENKDLKSDWRLMNQERYLMKKTLYFHKYQKYSEKWEHDHCDFCSKKFMENCENIDFCTTSGYSTVDNYHWICSDCYEDFMEIFEWTIIEKQ